MNIGSMRRERGRGGREDEAKVARRWKLDEVCWERTVLFRANITPHNSSNI